ncbi:uncharacterized protein [Chironomus tepperi]|uniref:uncharacterized protein n=1 Tax=Chironomus tepperi TaxID=113505 RepID=UPI00391F2C3F
MNEYWQNATFGDTDTDTDSEIESSYFEPLEQQNSSNQSIQQFQTNSEISDLEPAEQTNSSHQQLRPNSITAKYPIFYCHVCSADFPSFPYLNRHVNSKKHFKALEMDGRGKKMKQKKRYVRKRDRPETPNIPNSTPVEISNVQVLTLDEFPKIPELTPEDVELLNNITNIPELAQEDIEFLFEYDEEQGINTSENTTKNFYENLNFDLDIDEEPAKKQKLTGDEEIFQVIINKDPVIDGEFILEVPTIQHPVEEIREIVIDQRKIQCQFCPRKFKQHRHLAQHMTAQHSKDRNFRCDKCGKKFPDKKSLSYHLMRHAADKPFECYKCNKSYYSKIDWKRHVTRHDNMFNFNCPLCKRGFNRADHYQKHMYRHEHNPKGMHIPEVLKLK